MSDVSALMATTAAPGLLSGLQSALDGWALAGETVCLLAALCWSVAVTLFREPVARYGAQAVNLAKNVIATVLLGLTLLVIGGWRAILEAPLESLALVFFSGLLGVALGDTALLAAVPRLGVHRTLLWQTTGPVFAALLSLLVYGSLPTPTAGIGALVILAGVVVVVSERQKPPVAAGNLPVKETPAGLDVDVDGDSGAGGASGEISVAARNVLLGTALAVLAALGQGAGIVVAKAGMEHLEAVPASWVRLLAGAVGVAVVLAARRRLGSAAHCVSRWPALRQLTPAILLGTYIGMVLMMVGISATSASVAAVLLGTSPIFSLFIDAWMEGRRITWRGVLGTLLAVAGVGILATG